MKEISENKRSESLDDLLIISEEAPFSLYMYVDTVH
jgi:hypothetical protein